MLSIFLKVCYWQVFHFIWTLYRLLTTCIFPNTNPYIVRSYLRMKNVLNFQSHRITAVCNVPRSQSIVEFDHEHAPHWRDQSSEKHCQPPPAWPNINYYRYPPIRLSRRHLLTKSIIHITNSDVSQWFYYYNNSSHDRFSRSPHSTGYYLLLAIGWAITTDQ